MRTTIYNADELKNCVLSHWILLINQVFSIKWTEYQSFAPKTHRALFTPYITFPWWYFLWMNTVTLFLRYCFYEWMHDVSYVIAVGWRYLIGLELVQYWCIDNINQSEGLQVFYHDHGRWKLFFTCRPVIFASVLSHRWERTKFDVQQPLITNLERWRQNQLQSQNQ